VTGTLFVVATPIGNLEDITLRALRVLREVDLVAAEDTRRTGNLLRHYKIETPLVSMHEHNETLRIAPILHRLRAGQSVALVSDAGTPAISDPGATLVRAVRDAGFSVTPIPGPSAVLAAVSASGLRTGRFIFAEFPPVRSKPRKQWLEWAVSRTDEAVVFFEAPHRIDKTLSELGALLGKRPISVARELTKLHEEWREGLASTLARQFHKLQGEFVVVIPPARDAATTEEAATDEAIYALFGQIANNDAMDRRSAVREVAKRLSMTPKAVYEAIERAKNSGVRPT
jgi:16S rRNA (cytidine1402-2'-O)-methyltransferase